MLDVHPPEHPPHTWRDFLIHIATIVVGLLIAVGLEQTVEAIHHHHQCEQLREALLQDNQEALRDDQDLGRSALNRVQWLTARTDDVLSALRTKATPTPSRCFQSPLGAFPTIPTGSPQSPATSSRSFPRKT